MTHVLALETPDGALCAFTSPMPGALTPTRNGRTLTQGFVVTSPASVRFDEPPRVDDVVGFFVGPL